MTSEQAQWIIEISNRSADFWREVIRKQDAGEFYDLQRVEDASLKLWSEYVLFYTKEHSETLLRKRRNIRTTGYYGEVNSESWEKEIRYFLFKALGISEETTENFRDQLIRLVDPILDTLAESDLPQLQDVSLESLSPYQYEELCAEEMRLLGYDVRITKASGDQGVDVIARKGAVTIVLQCKMYSSPVGNKAVQEVYAGKKFHEADLAAVVSNHEFTESARQLAQALNVLLLHHSQLRAFFGEGSN